MSSSISGKFQDHYIALGLEPKADSEAIQTAYSKLARMYHPDTPETGDAVKFEAINMAYEVLSDPALRIEFDKLKGIDRDAGNPVFSGAGFFDALKEVAMLRSAVLCILCDRRRVKPFRPTVSLRDLENMLQSSSDQLNFALWYLKQRSYVVNDDKSNLQVTADGMDYLERNPPSPDAILPMIKPESIASPSANASVQPQTIPPPPGDRESSVLKALNRVLTRDHLAQDVRGVGPRVKA
jgi:curved DNA-binding protein CbpA